MQFVSDLHLHSRYSRAVSQKMNLLEMAKWAKKKGINILSTTDWTHPLWFREIKSLLKEDKEGFYRLKSSAGDNESEPYFLLSTEIANIYSQDGRVKRIHNLVFVPNLQTVEKINNELIKRSINLSSDGRPIMGLSSRQLLELLLTIDKKIILIPCHIWTPHFGVYGSASGFDSLEDCYGDLAGFIYGIETGISSDPLMNWQVEELDNRSILSFSDAHSAPKMGRETTVFELSAPSYINLGRAISAPMKRKLRGVKGDKDNVSHTIEFYPEEGKYHYAGHRNCKVVRSPLQIKQKGNVCPVCKKPLTEGVMYRVEKLGRNGASFDIQNEEIDENGLRWIKDPNGRHPPFVKLVPLIEILAESMSSTVLSQKVLDLFDKLCESFGSEISVLLKTEIAQIEKTVGPKIAEGIMKVRRGDIFIEPGFDGEYGKVKIWDGEAKNSNLKVQSGKERQLGLF